MNEQIEHNFTHHAPNKEQIVIYQELREKGKELAYMIDRYCKESRERSLAMTKVEEAIMWANAGIARNGAK